MSVPSVQPAPEKATNPGLIILYDVEAVHTALGEQGSPIVQGTTQAESVDAFKKYVFEVMMLHTPCSDQEHGVEKSTLGRRSMKYHPELLHRLPADTYWQVIQRLDHVFAYANTPTSEWSIRVSSSVLEPNALPPHRPLGCLIKVQGGVGQGQLLMEGVLQSLGIFHS